MGVSPAVAADVTWTLLRVPLARPDQIEEGCTLNGAPRQHQLSSLSHASTADDVRYSGAASIKIDLQEDKMACPGPVFGTVRCQTTGRFAKPVGQILIGVGAGHMGDRSPEFVG
jgi:hypothetical protein